MPDPLDRLLSAAAVAGAAADPQVQAWLEQQRSAAEQTGNRPAGWRITLLAKGHNVPAMLRLRRLLKYAGRACAFRVTYIEEVTDDDQR